MSLPSGDTTGFCFLANTCREIRYRYSARAEFVWLRLFVRLPRINTPTRVPHMNTPTRLVAIGAMAVFTIAGCSNTDSENVTTQGISADIEVLAEEGISTVSVRLEVGSGFGGTVLELSPGDTLTTMANGIQQTMIKDVDLFGDIEYKTSFPFDDFNTQFTVAFSRQNGINAPNSNVRLPEGFNVISPTPTTIYAYDDTVDIVWAPSGSVYVPDIRIAVACTMADGLVLTNTTNVPVASDTGSAQMPVAPLPPFGAKNTSQLCEGTIIFSRSRSGFLDPNYGEGGRIAAHQYHESRFFIDPATE